MARKEYLFASESFSEGNSDKLADLIVDTVVDAYLEKDCEAQLDINAFLSKQRVILGGKVVSKQEIDIEPLVRNVIKEVGYTDPIFGFDNSTCAIENYIETIEPSVSELEREYTDNHKLIFGFAVNDSDAYMPLPITLAHTLLRKLTALRKENILNFLYPDCSSQVTIQYDNKGKPKMIDSVIVVTQHNEKMPLKQLREALMEELIKKTIPNSLLDKSTKYLINPAGVMTEGGPAVKTGISGRRTMSDTYGGWCRFGDAPISGKDPYRIERSGNYMLRKIAKNIVAGGTAQKVELQAAYSNGIDKPVTLYVDTFETGKISDDKINKKIIENFDLSPKSIVNELDLLKSKYKNTSCYGHFGRHEADFTWEMIDRINDFK